MGRFAFISTPLLRSLVSFIVWLFTLPETAPRPDSQPMSEYQRTLKWRLDNDGGGQALLLEHTPDGSIRRKFMFDALDSPKLPRDLAEAIRKDGRTSGKLTLAP